MDIDKLIKRLEDLKLFSFIDIHYIDGRKAGLDLTISEIKKANEDNVLTQEDIKYLKHIVRVNKDRLDKGLNRELTGNNILKSSR